MARKYKKTVHQSGSPKAKSTSSKGKKGSSSSRSTSGRTQSAGSSKIGGITGRIRSLFSGLRKPTAPSGKSTPPTTKKEPIATGISLDRKLDILGIGLTLVGLLTIFAMLSSSNGMLTGGWISLLGKIFGWGMYLFSICLIAAGLWLVLRNFERIPTISVERSVGLALIFICLLIVLHMLTTPATTEEAFASANAGQGGGYVGAGLLQILQINLGWAGLAIALIAVFFIALALTLNLSIPDLFRWVPNLSIQLQDRLDDLRNGRGQQPKKSIQSPKPSSSPLQAGGGIPVESIPFPPPSPSIPTFTTIHGKQKTWILPSVDELLDKGGEVPHDDELDRQRARIVEETLASFGAPVNVVEINRGPTITQFGVEPDFIETRTGRTRVRVGKIAALADDLALALSARTIRVQAPVPGKGYVGIEVPNEEVTFVTLRDVIESEAFHRLKSPLRFALGQDVAGNAVAANLSNMHHLLIAGATGSGKSVCVNALICCLLLHNTPDELRLIMVDPKRVELTGYNGVPHLLAPVVVEMERVVGSLQWVLREMDQRYHKLAQAGTRNIGEYNTRQTSRGEARLPCLVVIIDELADLMIMAPDETERTITRLAQLARATGIHLVIATQRPSVDIITGLIKANFPARIAFAVAAGVDSRVILDQPGAERLLGRGDMLFQAPDAATPIRLQGVFVSEEEIQRLVQYWRQFTEMAISAPTAAGGIVDALPAGVPLKQMPLWDDMLSEEPQDPMLPEAIDLIRRQGRASISMLQRRLRIGYTRAARLIETMQQKGIIGSEPGPQGFEVLYYGPAAPPVDEL